MLKSHTPTHVVTYFPVLLLAFEVLLAEEATRKAQYAHNEAAVPIPLARDWGWNLQSHETS